MSARIYDAQLPVEQRRLKRAARALVKAVGSEAEAGEIAGLRQQRVSECTSINSPAFLTVDAVVALEEEARGSEGWPQVTRAMARQLGFELLPLPPAVPGDSPWHASLAAVSREVGDAIGCIVQSLADDNDVSAREIRERRIVEEINDAMVGLANLRGLCMARLNAEERG